MLAFLIVTAAVYWPGLSGGFQFDDYPNIVDNKGVQPHDASLSSLVGAALASPASEFKRPLASLSFAANYLASGLDPYWMKLSNLIIHLMNGLLVFLLARALLLVDGSSQRPFLVGAASAAMPSRSTAGHLDSGVEVSTKGITTEVAPATTADPTNDRAGTVAALIAGGWMLLPINLTGVLYVVQRMESMANLFVLLGLIGYVAGRRRMLGTPAACGVIPAHTRQRPPEQSRTSTSIRGFILCAASTTLPAAVGILAKETAVMLPLYAFLIEWILFGFQHPADTTGAAVPQPTPVRRSDRRILGLFVLVLALPMVAGLARLLPGLLSPEAWATRDFSLSTRLLSEARIVVDYIVWTLLPSPHALSFYHDNFHISSGLLQPWTTLASIALLGALVALMFWLRQRQPLTALGIALFLGCQLLTGTIIPLELIYEHRNYFASFGLLLAIVPLLAAPSIASAEAAPTVAQGMPMALPRYALLAGLMLCWAALTALTSYAWGNPLRLAEDLAARAPQSPRAQYELGRTYIIYSHYDPASPFIRLAYPPLERSAALPNSSILPEQALIFMNARMHLPLKDAWWDSMITKLERHKPGVQDESSLVALTQCAHEKHCKLPQDRMVAAYLAALSHPDPSARLLADYSNYCWNILGDRAVAIRMIDDAVKAAPAEPAYLITQVRMLAAESKRTEAFKALNKLQALNYGGRLNSDISQLRALPELK
ncbi:hypothetical protein GCM10027065_03760 [Rhodanobacter koreensis]